MKHLEGTFAGARDASIAYQGWVPEGDVADRLVVVHGLGEHCGRYGNLVNCCCPEGYAVYGLDHLGHGRSEGEREMVEGFADYVDSLRTFVDLVTSWHPDKPQFLIGHSMGGLIVTSYLLEHQDGIAGAVLSAPSVQAGDDISPATIRIVRLLAALAPTMGTRALDATSLSRDQDVVAAYVDDPLVFHGKTPARLGAEMLRAMEHALAEAHAIRVPLLILQDEKDLLVHPRGAQMLYDRVSSTDKTFKIYPGLYHEVFNEPERALVLDDVAEWLAARV